MLSSQEEQEHLVSTESRPDMFYFSAKAGSYPDPAANRIKLAAFTN